MHLVLTVASGLVTAYSFIIIFRVLVSWFGGERFGAAWRVLRLITDPVLRLFRGLRFLRNDAVDFTPIAAIVVLQILASLLSSFANVAFFSVMTIVAALVLAVWRIFFSILAFLAIVAIMRFIGLLASRNPYGFFFQLLDGILAPFVNLVTRVFPRGGQSDYRIVLGVVAGVFLVLTALGLFLIEPWLLVLCYRAGLNM